MNAGLWAENLKKEFGRREVVHGASIRLDAGEVVGLLGPNGAGKTTCFSMIAGLLRPDGGRVWLDGYDVTGEPLYARARRGIGYLPQEPSVFRGLSVEDNILLVLEETGVKRTERLRRTEVLLEGAGLTQVRRSKAQLLSGGERRRLEIARALATEPRYILLDEPFTGVDPLGIVELRERVRGMAERGVGILLTDHNVYECLRICDRAYLLYMGEILASGSPDVLLAHQKVRDVYLGPEFALERQNVDVSRRNQGR